MNGVFALLFNGAALVDIYLPTFRDNLSVLSVKAKKFKKKLFLDFLTLDPKRR